MHGVRQADSRLVPEANRGEVSMVAPLVRRFGPALVCLAVLVLAMVRPARAQSEGEARIRKFSPSLSSL